MNKDEFHGGVRYAGGKIEKAIGDAVDSRDWKVDGVVDQVAGGAQHSYGRARAIIDEAIDGAPAVADEARDRLKDSGERIADTAQRGGKAVGRAVQESPALWAAAAAIGGYALAYIVHGRRG